MLEAEVKANKRRALQQHGLLSIPHLNFASRLQSSAEEEFGLLNSLRWFSIVPVTSPHEVVRVEC